MEQLKKIQQLEKQVRRLKEELVTDELTQVLNRRGLMDFLQTYVREVSFQLSNPEKRRSVIITALTIIFVDVDHFKAINTKYGHQAGDVALQTVARLLKDNLRGIDLVGRYGGEEFVLGLVGADQTDGLKIAEDLRVSIEREKIHYDSKTFSVTVSMGLATLWPHLTLTQLIKRADQALYQAKNNGRNQVVVA